MDVLQNNIWMSKKFLIWHIFGSCEIEYVLNVQFDIIYRWVAAETLTQELHINAINMINYFFLSSLVFDWLPKISDSETTTKISLVLFWVLCMYDRKVKLSFSTSSFFFFFYWNWNTNNSKEIKVLKNIFLHILKCFYTV